MSDASDTATPREFKLHFDQRADSPKVEVASDKCFIFNGETIHVREVASSADSEQFMITEKFEKMPDGTVRHTVSDIRPVVTPTDAVDSKPSTINQAENSPLTSAELAEISREANAEADGLLIIQERDAYREALEMIRDADDVNAIDKICDQALAQYEGSRK